jgi:hypothetical protein
MSIYNLLKLARRSCLFSTSKTGEFDYLYGINPV